MPRGPGQAHQPPAKGLASADAGASLAPVPYGLQHSRWQGPRRHLDPSPAWPDGPRVIGSQAPWGPHAEKPTGSSSASLPSSRPVAPSSFWGLGERSPRATPVLTAVRHRDPCGRLCGSGVLFACRSGIGGRLSSAPSAPEGAWAAWGRTAVRALADSEASAWLSLGLSTGRARRPALSSCPPVRCGAGLTERGRRSRQGKRRGRGQGRCVP